MNQIRQGDLLFTQIKEIPQGFRSRPGNVLAHGEVTGHTHRIDADEVVVWASDSGELVIDGRSRALRVLHEEHDTVVLSALYRMERQREYDPDQAAREKRVAD